MTLPTIRALTLAEVETLVEWAAAEGWNPGLADAPAFHAADPEGFLGAFVDGRMVAGIAAVAYGQDYGFIGLYICREEVRGRGFGKAVWAAGMHHLAGRTVGLDGVDAQRANYRGKGFAAAYRTVRWSGRLDPGPQTTTIVPAVSVHSAELERLDGLCFPARRTSFLERWIAPPHVALIAVEDGMATGFGVARRCHDGVKIGPLVAPSDQVAMDLLSDLAAALPGQSIHLDVPDQGGPFVARLETLGFTPGFVTTRMYRGPLPAIRVPYAVTSLELG